MSILLTVLINYPVWHRQKQENEDEQVHQPNLPRMAAAMSEGPAVRMNEPAAGSERPSPALPNPPLQGFSRQPDRPEIFSNPDSPFAREPVPVTRVVRPEGDASVRVLCYPWARVEFIGTSRDEPYRFTAPMRDTVRIPGGAYEMQLSRDGKTLLSRAIRLDPGEDYEFKIRLDRNTFQVQRGTAGVEMVSPVHLQPRAALDRTRAVYDRRGVRREVQR